MIEAGKNLISRNNPGRENDFLTRHTGL